METPAYVTRAFAKVGRARAIRDERKAHFEGISDRVDAAETDLRRAQVHFLDTPEAPAVKDAMDAARAAHADLAREQDESARWLLSADDLLNQATAAHDLAVKQWASERVRANSEKLEAVAKQLDAHFEALADLLPEADRLNRLIAHDAKTDLGASVVVKLRTIVMERMTQNLARIRVGEEGKFIAARDEAERFVANLDRFLIQPPEGA